MSVAEGGTGSEPRRWCGICFAWRTEKDGRCSRCGNAHMRGSVEVGSGHDEQTEGRIRELETALKPFADAYERGVAGDHIWPADQSFYRQAYHTLRGTSWRHSGAASGANISASSGITGGGS